MAYAAEVLTDSPTVYLQLRDTVGSTSAADASGNSHTGTLTSDVDGQDPAFGFPGLIAGGYTCLKLPVLSSGDYIRTDNIGPSTNFTVEAIIRVHSASNYQLVVDKPDAFTALCSVNAGPSSNPGFMVSVDAVAGGAYQAQVGGSALAVGQRTHLAFEYTGTVGVIGAGGPRLKVYVDNSLTLDQALGTTIDLDLFYTTNYIQIAGYGLYVEELAYYDHELTSSRIAAHMAEMGDVLGFLQAIETDLGRQIGYPRSLGIGQAPSLFAFDPTLQVPANAPQPGTGEYAERIRQVQARFLPLGKAIETDTTAQMVVDLVPWITLDLALADFHTSPVPQDFGFYADGLIQPDTFGTGPSIDFTHPDLRLADLDVTAYYDIEITFDAASTQTFTGLAAYLDDSDTQWWNESPFELGIFGNFSSTPLVIRAIIGSDVPSSSEWDEAFAANYQSLNFSFGNRSYISQIRWRVSSYVVPGPATPTPIQAVAPEPATTRRVFPPRRLAAR